MENVQLQLADIDLIPGICVGFCIRFLLVVDRWNTDGVSVLKNTDTRKLANLVKYKQIFGPDTLRIRGVIFLIMFFLNIL